jgi:hypothetical protein
MDKSAFLSYGESMALTTDFSKKYNFGGGRRVKMKGKRLFVIVLLLSISIGGCAVDRVTRLQSDGIDLLVDMDIEGFKEDIREAYRKAPEDPYVMNNMGVVYEIEGNMQRARELYRKAADNAGDRRVAKSSKETDVGRLLKDVATDNYRRVEIK